MELIEYFQINNNTFLIELIARSLLHESSKLYDHRYAESCSKWIG